MATAWVAAKKNHFRTVRNINLHKSVPGLRDGFFLLKGGLVMFISAWVIYRLNNGYNYISGCLKIAGGDKRNALRGVA